MSGERPQREVAYRLFAAEFEDSDFTYAESDEERAPNYVVTPTGARVNRLFVVGVLTETEQVSDDVLRARIVDPTGAFVVYAGQYQPEALAFFERTDPPAFVAVTGKARTFQPDDSDIIYTSVRPESANEVTVETRDRWVVQTAEQTLDRVETFAGALALAERGDALADALVRRGIQPSLAAGIPKALDHYGTTTGYLAEVHRLALDAARVVANELDEVEGLALAPDEGEDVALEFEYSLPEPEYEVEGEAEGEREAEVDREDQDEGEMAETAAEAEAEAEAEAAEEPAEPEEVEEPAVPEADEEPSEPEPVDEGGDSTAEVESAETAPVDESAKSEPDDEEEEPDDDEAEPEGVVEETDEMYELSEEEREEVESEFGVDFETGNEVQAPGEAGIETPEPEEGVDEDAAEAASAEAETVEESAEGTAETTADEASEDVDLEDVVVETMGELDDGDGAPRDDLVQTVVEEYDVTTDAVEGAIQDALMGGRCYEPTDGRITPI